MTGKENQWAREGQAMGRAVPDQSLGQGVDKGHTAHPNTGRARKNPAKENMREGKKAPPSNSAASIAATKESVLSDEDQTPLGKCDRHLDMIETLFRYCGAKGIGVYESTAQQILDHLRVIRQEMKKVDSSSH